MITSFVHIVLIALTVNNSVSPAKNLGHSVKDQRFLDKTELGTVSGDCSNPHVRVVCAGGCYRDRNKVIFDEFVSWYNPSCRKGLAVPYRLIQVHAFLLTRRVLAVVGFL